MSIIGFNTRSLWQPGIYVLFLAVLAAYPLFGSTYSIILLISILMYVILAVSWTMFSGPTGYFSLAPAAFFGIGIYTSATLGMDYPFWSLILIGGALSSVVALLVGALTLRLRGIYFTIFTFGLVELMKHFLLWYEVRFTGTRGRFVVLIDNETIFYALLIILVVLLITFFIIRRSKYGLALQSIGEYEEAAAHMGINVTLLKVLIFGLSAFFMGAAGAVMATRWTYVDPYIAFYLLFSFMPVLMAILGGMGQFYGPIIGAGIIAYLEELLLTKFPYYYMLIFGAILVIAILYLPQGLSGLIEKWIKRIKGEKRAHT